ncbi:hypothetical protein WJX81_000121 [Elliptochloris bilobata]|uniref:Uncharacterized protein n=1 Tax=Elliptochloris bilobata TaxID=381761 RepID=A0AAW1RMS2_9CHLO
MARVDVKVVLLGQQSVGKSCLVDRYINNAFEAKQKNTIGAAFAAKKVKVSSGRVVSLGVWDTAGAERFESLSRMYYNGARAAVVCFDPADRLSFEKAMFWVRELRDTQPECRVYLAMTKCDLLEDPPALGPADALVAAPGSDDSAGAESAASKQSASSTSLASHSGLRREVSDEDVASFAKSVALPRYGPAKVFPTSARHGRGVAALFQEIGEDLSAGLSAEEPRPPEGNMPSALN